MKTIPANLESYRKTPVFDETSIPKALLKDHDTKEEVWGKIQVVEGTLLYFIGEDEPFELTPGNDGIVEPLVVHRIAPKGSVKFFVEFFR